MTEHDSISARVSDGGGQNPEVATESRQDGCCASSCYPGVSKQNTLIRRPNLKKKLRPGLY